MARVLPNAEGDGFLEEVDSAAPPIQEEPPPPAELPRAIGDKVRLRAGLKEKNGLKEGEMCDVSFANVKYGNYKVNTRTSA